MKRSKFSDEQIIGILKEHEAGVATAELCRRHGISTATFYAWRKKFGGMASPQTREARADDHTTAAVGFPRAARTRYPRAAS